MKRRNFLSLSALASLAVISPLSLQAEDFRETKASAWTAHTVDDAIKNMYGDISLINKGVTIDTPKVASNGGNIPVNITSDISARSVALFQDANPEAAVAVFTVPDGGSIDYDIKIKMSKSGTITAVVEGRDGKFYAATRTLDVALGGCEG